MNKETIDKQGRCYISDLRIERRAEGEASRTIIGYAVKFNVRSKPIWGCFEEIIKPGAFDGCDMSDVVMTYQHNESSILARSSSKTLSMSIDDIGVKFSFEAPNTTLGNDMLELVSRGDIKECSFVFSVRTDKWTYRHDENDMEYDLREVEEIAKLWDLALVVRAAYPDTEASRRAYREFRAEKLSSPSNDTVVDVRSARKIDQRAKIIRFKSLS